MKKITQPKKDGPEILLQTLKCQFIY